MIIFVITFINTFSYAQIIKDTEESEKSEPCRNKHNMDYDKCVYDANHFLLANHSKCSFNFFVGNSRSFISNSSNECKLLKLSSKDKEYFQTILGGRQYSLSIHIDFTTRTSLRNPNLSGLL